MTLLDLGYPVALAAANLAAGWLRYGVLDSGLGVVLGPVGVMILLVVGLEWVGAGVRGSGA